MKRRSRKNKAVRNIVADQIAEHRSAYGVNPDLDSLRCMFRHAYNIANLRGL